MIAEIYAAQKLALVSLAIFAGIVALQVISRRMQTKMTPKERRQIYACGEDIGPEELNIPHGSFYKSVVHVLGIDRATLAHTGDLSAYLSWIIIGLVIIVGVMILLW